MKIICFEGVNGVGKSVICDQINKELNSLGLNVLRLREPGGTAFGEQVLRPILKNENAISAGLTPDARLYLFLASRAMNANVIEKTRYIDYVILDRYTPSTLVYNGLASGKSMLDVYELEKHARKDIKPDVTFYINAKTSEIVSRLWKRDYKGKEDNELVVKNNLLDETKRLQDYYMNVNSFLRVEQNWRIQEITNGDGQFEDSVYKIMGIINGIR